MVRSLQSIAGRLSKIEANVGGRREDRTTAFLAQGMKASEIKRRLLFLLISIDAHEGAGQGVIAAATQMPFSTGWNDAMIEAGISAHVLKGRHVVDLSSAEQQQLLDAGVTALNAHWTDDVTEMSFVETAGQPPYVGPFARLGCAKRFFGSAY